MEISSCFSRGAHGGEAAGGWGIGRARLAGSRGVRRERRGDAFWELRGSADRLSLRFSMDRISAAFAKARSENRACFVAYLCAGDPDFETSVACCRELVEAGTDILELGVPFSDPVADGLTNQLAAQRALESGMTLEKVYELAREVRGFTDIPIIFYTYYNLVYASGLSRNLAKVREAGVDGLLTLDLPPEEAGEMLEASRAEGLKNIFIVAPTTTERRLSKIAEVASGFVYYVSREGVTGERDSVASGLKEAMARIRKAIDLPTVVGFGISRREHVRQVAAVADGVVVGSALVNCIRDHLGDREAILRALRAKADDLVAGLRATEP